MRALCAKYQKDKKLALTNIIAVTSTNKKRISSALANVKFCLLLTYSY